MSLSQQSEHRYFPTDTPSAPITQSPGPNTTRRPCSPLKYAPPCRCSGSTAKSLLFRFLPILRWLPRYPVKEWLLGDIISGFSVGIMHLPQGKLSGILQSLAYALLAGLPPVIGLYSAFYPVLMYFFFGTSRHISVGPFAVISVMIGSVTDSLEPGSKYMEKVNGTNETVLNEAQRDAARVELVSALTLLVGIFQIALGLLQFGFVVSYLSEPLVRGYTTAAAVQVLISQLKYVFGIQLEEHSGPLSLIYTFLEICSKLPGTNVGALVTSLVAMVSIFPVKLLNQKIGKKLPIPIPIELLTIIVSTGISYGAKLNQHFGISVVGDIPSGMRPPQVPGASHFGKVVGNAFAIAIVSYVIGISLGKIFALKHGYKVDSNQELIALGLSNSVGGFFQCYSISCSMSRSLVQESSGGHSQVAGVVSCLVILVTILKIGELFRELPKAILAAIIIVNLKGMFKQFNDIPALWRSNINDLCIWLVTFVATILLNLDLGLAPLGPLLMPHEPPTLLCSQAEEVPGVKIFRSSATVYFANADLYAETLKKKCGIDVDRLIEKKKKAQRKWEKKNRKEVKKTKVLPSICVKDWASQNDTQQPQSQDNLSPSLKTLGLEKPPFHSLILDFTPVNFVDTVCIKTLKNVRSTKRERSAASSSVISQLERGNFFSQTITKHQLFASVHDAVSLIYCLCRPEVPSPVAVWWRPY
uniref:Solute carrier family 26 member 6 n=1 Tax=Varanus komodoensis TaxID=61221 RepID=A0A8D2L532_VARKO